MLLPLRVAHAYQRAPVATWTLIGVNVGMFLLTLALGPEGVAPLVLSSRAFAPYQLLTSMFLHSGVLHLAGNMLFLWVYGRYVEERTGPWRYVAIYLACGVVGDLFFLGFTGGSSVGASGAISGLMGFVLVGAPWAEVQILWMWGPYGASIRTFHVAAFWLVGMWVLFQVLSAASGWGVISRVAYAAHIGGCLAGAGIAWYLRSPTCKGTAWYLDPSPPGGGPEATRRLRRARGMASHAASEPGFHVEVQSLDDAPSRVAVIRLLMKRCGMEPDAANDLLEEVDGGSPTYLGFPEVDAADGFAREARGLGVRVAFDAPVQHVESAPSVPTPAPSQASEPQRVDWDRPPVSTQPDPEIQPKKRHEETDRPEGDARDASATFRLASGQVLELEPEND